MFEFFVSEIKGIEIMFIKKRDVNLLRAEDFWTMEQ